MSALRSVNARLFAGVDEVGRGCLAGPVVAAVVILDPAKPLAGLADSKSLSAGERARFAVEIRNHAVAWALGRAEAEEIDRINILRASLLAMARAVRSGLSELQSVWVRVDGAHFPDIELPGEAVIKGDRLHAEISAASILAKVHRDEEMQLLDRICPGYGFAMHKGYPTRKHSESLRKLGPSLFHRLSFKPVKDLL
ncbi:MAG: ribonuclease HII [Methylococcales bacterium]